MHREELENGRIFNELCSLNSSNRPQVSGRIRKQPTTLYEQFKQSSYDEPVIFNANSTF
jgi:hypothetical protein